VVGCGFVLGGEVAAGLGPDGAVGGVLWPDGAPGGVPWPAGAVAGASWPAGTGDVVLCGDGVAAAAPPGPPGAPAACARWPVAGAARVPGGIGAGGAVGCGAG
jgi:hypothetical protein